LGFYPLPPGSNQYAFGITGFEEIQIAKPDGKYLIVKNHASDSIAKHIKINDRIIESGFWRHDSLSRNRS